MMFTAFPAPRRRRFIPVAAIVLLLTTSLPILFFSTEQAAAEPQPAPMWLGAATRPVTGSSFYVSGGVRVSDDLTGQTVSIFKREMGQTSDTLVAEVPLAHQIWGNFFQTTLPGLTYTAVLTASWAGNADYLPSSYWTCLPVRAKVTIAVARQTAKFLRLRATVSPLQPQDAPAFLSAKNPFVLFQRKVSGTWRYLGGADTMSTDSQSWQTSTYYHLKPGTYVLRGRFVGSDYNTAAVSKTLRLTVR